MPNNVMLSVFMPSVAKHSVVAPFMIKIFLFVIKCSVHFYYSIFVWHKDALFHLIRLKLDDLGKCNGQHVRSRKWFLDKSSGAYYHLETSIRLTENYKKISLIFRLFFVAFTIKLIPTVFNH